MSEPDWTIWDALTNANPEWWDNEDNQENEDEDVEDDEDD